MTMLSDKLSYTTNLDVSSIVKFIEESPDEALYHIDLVMLGNEYGYDLEELLNIFIYGVKNGVFIMEWEYHCPHCGGIAKETSSLHSAEHENYCQVCKIDFINKLDVNVEVYFSIHPNIRQISDEYRKAFNTKMMESINKTMMFQWKNKNTISGIHIIQNNIFREMMGDEVLQPDQSLEIMHSTILFTDIKSSTEMYSKLGDAVAFRIVRDHFRILFKIIKEYNGVPVKTIGDAVMGVFINEQKALLAALEIQRNIIAYSANKKNDEKIILKIGIHSGSTIVVTLNGRLDYFGNSVNTAARIQAQALPGEVVISETIFESEQNKKIIGKYVKKVSKNKIILKGIKNEINLFHIKFIDNYLATIST